MPEQTFERPKFDVLVNFRASRGQRDALRRLAAAMNTTQSKLLRFGLLLLAHEAGVPELAEDEER